MFSLDFSSPLPGTVLDKDNEGTGFISVQPNKTGNQYEPSRINLAITDGTLILTGTQGTSADANTLRNALQVPINSTQPFTISTRLIGPFTNLKTAYQQGGIFLGSSQDDYVKLVIVNTGNGTDGLGLQFYQEQNGVRSSVGAGSEQQIKGLDWAGIRTLDFFLTGDPVTKNITAAYRVNSDTAAPSSLSQKFKPNQTERFFAATNTRAGILAFTKNAADVPITFDSFGIAQDVKINFQSSNAVPAGGYIKDSGEAYNSTRGYGWVSEASLASATHTPLDISAYARQRNRTGVDPRLKTLLHMQYPNTPAAAASWEYALPNGIYRVTVSVGDQIGRGGVYDSKHTINVEGVNAINSFQSTSAQEYQISTVTVNVTDGKLTVDAIGGINTKLNYLEIVNVTPGTHPSVTGSEIGSDETGVYLNTSINLDVSLPTVGAGVDQATLNTDTVELYRTKDNARVPGLINTTGGGDAIVFQPTGLLNANTNYTFRVTNAVRDESSATFIPYSTTFNTGTKTSVSPTEGVNFTKSTVYTGDPLSSLAVGPDGRLYAATLNGKLHRWTIDSSGNLTNIQTLAPPQLADRAVIGIAFDPSNSNVWFVWTTGNDPLFPQPATDFTGKISKVTLSGSGFDTSSASIQDYVVGLPRSAKDHLSNSLAFGPDGKLYMTQGSNSAMGAPDPAWYNRPERLLSASVLQIDSKLTPPSGGFNVQTENYQGMTGNYNPYAANAPVKIYATGVRNAYDLVWHSNGNLYVPANGSAAGGNTPDDPTTTVKEALSNVGTQNDYLLKILPGGYYGHPNPSRGEYILNGGNPTSEVDPAEVVAQGQYAGYAVGTQPEPNYRGFVYDFGRNRSADGIIEYKSDTFNRAIKNKLLVVNYSGGDNILALAPDADGNIPRGNVTQLISGLTDPLDLVEDTRNNRGNLYVAELIGGGISGQISLLKGS